MRPTPSFARCSSSRANRRSSPARRPDGKGRSSCRSVTASPS